MAEEEEEAEMEAEEEEATCSSVDSTTEEAEDEDDADDDAEDDDAEEEGFSARWRARKREPAPAGTPPEGGIASRKACTATGSRGGTREAPARTDEAMGEEKDKEEEDGEGEEEEEEEEGAGGVDKDDEVEGDTCEGAEDGWAGGASAEEALVGFGRSKGKVPAGA